MYHFPRNVESSTSEVGTNPTKAYEQIGNILFHIKAMLFNDSYRVAKLWSFLNIFEKKLYHCPQVCLKSYVIPVKAMV